MAVSREEVAGMIQKALGEFEQKVGVFMGEKAKELVSLEQAKTEMDAAMTRVREEFKMTEERINKLIELNNTKFEEHETGLNKIVTDLAEAGVSGPRIATALDGTKLLNQKNEETRAVMETLATELRGQVESTKASSAAEIESVRQAATFW